MKILIIEDDRSLREIIKIALDKEHFISETAATYASALEKINLYAYDCILLDIMLPDGNGIDLLRQLKQAEYSANIIIISAKDAIEDKIEGLDLGADDYLAKPFYLAELIARIKSVVRRNNHDGKNYIAAGNVKIFPESKQVFIENNALLLGRKEYDILYFFINRMQHVINKEMLAEAVWGDHADQVDNYDFVYAQIKNLKRKLKEGGATIEINAIYGFGYKMIVN